MFDGIDIFLHKKRSELEKCWVQESSYSKQLWLFEEIKSFGQCFVSSYLLHEQMQDTHIVRGFIKKGRKIIFRNHCWLESYKNKKNIDDKYIIDITADQIGNVCKVVYGFRSDIKKNHGLTYIPQKQYQESDLNNLDIITKMRLSILKSNYDNLTKDI